MLISIFEVLILEKMRSNTCCFSGHRAFTEEDISKIRERLDIEIVNLIEQGYSYFCVGGALGFDTLAALTVLNEKNNYPYIKLILVLPCQAQSKYWNKCDQKIYENIKSKADEIIYTSERYYRGCMHKRNRQLVDCSSACICYLNKSSGGTAYTVVYAKKCGINIVNVADY